MRSKYIVIVVVLVALAFGVGRLSAGSVDSPGDPTSEAAKMYTLEDIYNRINDGTAATKQTFTEPSSGPGTGTMHTLNDIYDLIGERAPVPKTGDSYNDSCCTGEDGELQKGVTWPSPRFTDNLDGTVTDNLTGLIWLKNANCFGTKTWAQALSAANTLNSGECGLSDGSSEGDWRLSNVRELSSLMDSSQYDPALPSGHLFTNVPTDPHWSSTTQASLTMNSAWLVPLYYGDDYVALKTSSSYYVWPVRGGQ